MKLASRSCRGFTLIEVMVALTIVALSLTAAAATMAQMVSTSQTMRDRTYASWIAQNRIAEIRLASELPKVGSTDGEVEFANTEWSWRATVSETGVERLLRVDVAVRLADIDDPVRTVTGFVGPKGSSIVANEIWTRGLTTQENPPEQGATE